MRSETNTEGRILVFDGDGDGTSAAAIYLIGREQKPLQTITNQIKSERGLVGKIFDSHSPESLTGREIGIFDIDAESNQEALELLAQSTTNVTYIDHHTRDISIIPNKFEKIVEKDTRENSTTTLTYEHAQNQGRLSTDKEKRKASQLAVIGLANDGKGRASAKFGSECISEDERKKLITYAKAINFGSGSGRLNSRALLEGLTNAETPLIYLEADKAVQELVITRDEKLKKVKQKTAVTGFKKARLYEFPHTTAEEKYLSEQSYNEHMNSLVETHSEYIHIGLLRIPDDQWRISVRSQTDHSAVNIAQTIASKYEVETKGRETAAGFDVPGTTSEKELKEKISEVLHELH